MAYTCSKDASHQSTDSDYCSICGAKIVGAASVLSGSTPAAASVAAAAVRAGSASAGDEICPDCGTARHTGARFCEICRYNFDAHTSGGGAPPLVVPTAPPPIVASLVATVTAPPVQTGFDPAPPPLDNAVPPVPPLPLASMSDAPPPPLAPAPSADSAPLSATASPPLAPAGLLKWEAHVVVDPSLYTDPDPDLPLPTEEPERNFPLDFAENLLGRRSDRKDIHPEIPVGDPGVSHRHAKLLRQPDGSFQLLDVGSTNGTRLNGVEVKPGVRTPLQDGDQITLGCWTRITIRTHS